MLENKTQEKRTNNVLKQKPTSHNIQINRTDITLIHFTFVDIKSHI